MEQDAGDVWTAPGDVEALYQPLPFRNEHPLAYTPDTPLFVHSRSSSGSSTNTTTFVASGPWTPDPLALPMPVAAPSSEPYRDDYAPHHTYTSPSLHSPASTHSSHSSAQHSHKHDDMETNDTHDNASDHTDHATSASTAQPGKQKQSVLQRRRRNRESMRRSRLKEKEILTSLRSTLSQLEEQYATLTHWEAQSLARTDPWHVAHCKALQRKLAHALQLKRELEGERRLIQRFLLERQATMRELSKVLADECDFESSDAVAEKLALLEHQVRTVAPASLSTRAAPRCATLATSECGFEPLSLEAVDALLRTFVADLARVKASAAADDAHEPLLEVLGWQTHQHIDAQNTMHFAFTKHFYHWSTHDLGASVWADATNMAQYKETQNKKHFQHLRRVAFLQRVSDRIGIVVREVVHPDDHTVFRTHYALFMLETRDGLLFGIQSINPSAEVQQQLAATAAASDEKVVWADASISVELLRRPRTVEHPQESHDATDRSAASVRGDDDGHVRQDYCEVRWRGKTNYKTPKHAAENAVRFLMGVLAWENDVAGPRFHLTAS